jgi:hypothetical protein
MDADDNGMVAVEAAIDGVKDNGKTYAAGQEFHMHKDLVPGHVAAGQVRVAGTGSPEPGARKQARAPRDKQATGAADK